DAESGRRKTAVEIAFDAIHRGGIAPPQQNDSSGAVTLRNELAVNDSVRSVDDAQGVAPSHRLGDRYDDVVALRGEESVECRDHRCADVERGHEKRSGDRERDDADRETKPPPETVANREEERPSDAADPCDPPFKSRSAELPRAG